MWYLLCVFVSCEIINRMEITLQFDVGHPPLPDKARRSDVITEVHKGGPVERCFWLFDRPVFVQNWARWKLFKLGGVMSQIVYLLTTSERGAWRACANLHTLVVYLFCVLIMGDLLRRKGTEVFVESIFYVIPGYLLPYSSNFQIISIFTKGSYTYSC